MNSIGQKILNTLSRSIVIQTRYCLSKNISFESKLKIMYSSALRKSVYFFSNAKPDEQIFQQTLQVTQSVSNLQFNIKNPKTIEVLKRKGIQTLFPIQVETFEAVYQGRDILASDRTGSGKTIAYALPIIQKLRDAQKLTGSGNVKFLILCPTRELAIQVFKQIESLKHNRSDYNVIAIYGGSSIQNQIRELRNGIDIVVATPGRLMDLFQRNVINFSQLEATCIDEADQMLQKGFKLDIEQIFKRITSQQKNKTQNLMFSATIPDWVDQIARQYLTSNRKKINLINKHETQTSTTVEHLAVQCSHHEKLEMVKNLIKSYNPTERTIVFGETKIEVNEIANEFGNKAVYLQGDMSQREREHNLGAFRNGSKKILVATDVASRGLDIQDVGLVIQLSPPKNTEPFIHRAGRTGRAGKEGICITFFDKRKHLYDMVRIQNQAKITFTNIPKPSRGESAEGWQKKLNEYSKKLRNIHAKEIKNDKLNLIADTLIASSSDIHELVKSQIVAMIGPAPGNQSLTTGQPGYRTYVLESKSDALDSIKGLTFLKSLPSSIGITDVHPQAKNIIFDIPEGNIKDFAQSIQRQQFKSNKAYSIKEATFKDRQLPSLKQLSRAGSGSGGFGGSYNQVSRTSQRQRGGERTQRYNVDNDQTLSPEDLNVFIPRLPYEVTQEQILQAFEQNQIQVSNVKLIKKSEQNIFAFAKLHDVQDFKLVIKKGLRINDTKCTVYKSQDNKKRSGFEGGRNQRSNERGSYGQGNQRHGNQRHGSYRHNDNRNSQRGFAQEYSSRSRSNRYDQQY